MAITTKGSSGQAVSVGAGNYAINILGANSPVDSIVIIDWAYNSTNGISPDQKGTFRIGGTGATINILMKDPGPNTFITWTAVAINIV